MSNLADRVMALKLHSLHQDDREWILSQLDPASYKHLQPLLDELQELGFKVDLGLVDSIQHETYPNTAHKSEDRYWIDSATSGQIKKIFDKEPGFLLNCLSSQHEWKWLHGFNQSLATDARITPSRSKHKKITPNARSALFKAVAHRIKVEDKLPGDEVSRINLPTRIQGQLLKLRNKVLPWK